MKGTVTTYFPKKGYGWIIPDGERVRRYFHAANYFGVVIPTWGLRVEYSLAPADRAGFPDQAVDVRPAEVAQ